MLHRQLDHLQRHPAEDRAAGEQADAVGGVPGDPAAAVRGAHGGGQPDAAAAGGEERDAEGAGGALRARLREGTAAQREDGVRRRGAGHRRGAAGRQVHRAAARGQDRRGARGRRAARPRRRPAAATAGGAREPGPADGGALRPAHAPGQEGARAAAAHAEAEAQEHAADQRLQVPAARAQQARLRAGRREPAADGAGRRGVRREGAPQRPALPQPRRRPREVGAVHHRAELPVLLAGGGLQGKAGQERRADEGDPRLRNAGGREAGRDHRGHAAGAARQEQLRVLPGRPRRDDLPAGGGAAQGQQGGRPLQGEPQQPLHGPAAAGAGRPEGALAVAGGRAVGRAALREPHHALQLPAHQEEHRHGPALLLRALRRGGGGLPHAAPDHRAGQLHRGRLLPDRVPQGAGDRGRQERRAVQGGAGGLAEPQGALPPERVRRPGAPPEPGQHELLLHRPGHSRPRRQARPLPAQAPGQDQRARRAAQCPRAGRRRPRPRLLHHLQLQQHAGPALLEHRAGAALGGVGGVGGGAGGRGGVGPGGAGGGGGRAHLGAHRAEGAAGGPGQPAPLALPPPDKHRAAAHRHAVLRPPRQAPAHHQQAAPQPPLLPRQAQVIQFWPTYRKVGLCVRLYGPYLCAWGAVLQ